MKSAILLLVVAIIVCLSVNTNSKPLTHDSPSAATDKEYENGIDLLRRFTRQAVPSNGNNNNNSKMCKYKKGSWSACDPQTKIRTRTFTLKRGDTSVCEEQKTVRKECKGKKEGKGGGKKNKSRDKENNNNQQNKNRDRADRPRKNKHNNN